MMSLSRTFLPAGFPASVPPEYLRYQAWNVVQDLSSSLRGVLCTQKILEGIRCIYICCSIHTYIHKYVCVYIYVHVYICTCMYMYIYIHIYTLPHTHTHTHPPTHTAAQSHTHPPTHTHTWLIWWRRWRYGRGQRGHDIATSVCRLKQLVYAVLSY